MTQRERFLAMAVGGLLVVIILQWGIGKYRGALRTRQNQIASLQNEQVVLNERMIAGAYADRQMGEYLVRSLSSDPETARSTYQSWLLSSVREQGLVDASVDPISEAADGDLFRRYGYRVTGRTDLDGLVELLYSISANNTLHRVRDLVFAPARTGDLSVEMMIDAISLNAAPATVTAPSSDPSWRTIAPLADIRERILDRNFFQPSNQPPVYRGSSELLATKGQTSNIQLAFEDPEKSALAYSIRGELPEWAKFDPKSGKISFDAPKDASNESAPIQLTVEVTDQGRPARSITKTLAVKFQDPPPPAPAPTPPPGFDDATQTYVSALLDGEEQQVWMNVRTRGETVKLRIGDEFQIGSIRGKVVGMNSRSVRLEIDGAEYELRPATKLSDVTK